MREKPVHRDASIINGGMWNSIIAGGLFMACYSFLFLTMDPIQSMFAREALHDTPPPPDEVHDAAASETPGELHGQVYYHHSFTITSCHSLLLLMLQEECRVHTVLIN
jgi:hypothetical protein